MAEGRRSILVVEDDDDTRQVICDVVADLGYTATPAASGAAALALLHGGLRPHAILLDVMMPGGDGVAFRRAQQGDPTLSRIPVIVATGLPLTGDHASALAPTTYLRKPYALADLATALCTATRSTS